MHPISPESPLAAALTTIDLMIARINQGEQVATHELETLAAQIRSTQAQAASSTETEPAEQQAMAAGAAS